MIMMQKMQKKKKKNMDSDKWNHEGWEKNEREERQNTRRGRNNNYGRGGRGRGRDQGGRDQGGRDQGGRYQGGRYQGGRYQGGRQKNREGGRQGKEDWQEKDAQRDNTDQTNSPSIPDEEKLNLAAERRKRLEEREREKPKRTKAPDRVLYVPPSRRKVEENLQDNPVILVMQIEVSSGEMKQIEVKINDNPEDLARDFCKQHGMADNLVITIANAIQENLQAAKADLTDGK